MTYILSDVHGEYDLFLALLRRISFCDRDVMYICGDVIDKGRAPARLARLVSKYPNIKVILGNHEYEFLKYYHSLMADETADTDSVMSLLREYFVDGDYLDWDTVDFIVSLPAYIETEDFICAHSGVPILPSGTLAPLDSLSDEELLYDRRFKERTAVHHSPKCVFFGHTETNYVNGKNEIIAYPRAGAKPPYTISDFYKVHLDTGTWHSGTLGCFCIENCMVYYVT